MFYILWNTAWTPVQRSAKGDHNYAAIASGAGRNAIPDVVAAPPGLRTPLDLPFNTARGVFAAAQAG